jgi:hypothetical protein
MNQFRILFLAAAAASSVLSCEEPQETAESTAQLQVAEERDMQARQTRPGARPARPARRATPAEVKWLIEVTRPRTTGETEK